MSNADEQLSPSPKRRSDLEGKSKKKCDVMAAGGSAVGKQIGPVVGLVDIGESDDAYLFRVSLAGVKRDENELSCIVETNGKVMIRGVTTTGERYVYRFSQLFAMLSSNLSPPGPFSIEFQLPGPVNPQQISVNYGTDGVLEGIVMKRDSGVNGDTSC